MNSQLIKTLKLVRRWFWLTGAMLVIGTVIFIVIGRQTITQLDELRPTVQSVLSDSIGMQVKLGELKGEWPRLKPIIDIEKIEIIAEDQTAALVLEQGRANLDVFSTLKYRTPIWRELMVDKLALTLIEDASGKWGLKGLAGNTETDLKIITDPIFYSRLISLKEVTVNLQFFSGKLLQVHGDNVQLENDTDFHRAELSLRIADQDVPVFALIEGQGDPADLESFHADGYLQLKDFNISKSLVTLIKPLLPELFANLAEFQANASGEIWIDFHPGGALDFEGNLAISEIPLDWLADVPPVENVSTEITGWFTPGLDWGTRLQSFDFSWSDADIDPLDLVFTQRLGSRWQDFDVSFNHLDLTVLADLLGQTRMPSNKILEIIDELQPQGSLGALTLGHAETGYYVQANLDGIEMKPYKGVPGVKGLNGYIELDETGGLFHIDDSDGFDVYFPLVYRDYISVKKALGTTYLDWQPDNKTLVVRSEPILTVIDAGTALIMYSVEQQLPSNGVAPVVSLVVGGRDIDAKYSSQYLPYKMPAALSSWLDTAVLSGNVKEFGILFHGGPPRLDRTAKTTQLLFDMENTNINYHPDWLGLRNIQTVVLADDGYVEGTANAGNVGGANIIEATAIYDTEVPPAQRLLIVDSSITSEMSAAISILDQSPLKKNIGPLAGWETTGQAAIDMHLEIPLVSKAVRAKGNVPTGNYQLSAELADGSMAIPNTSIAVKQLAGSVTFSLQDGLQSQNMTGLFWDEPLTAKLYKTDGEQKLAFKTEFKPQSLTSLVDFPWPEVLSGMIPVDGLISLPAAADKKPVTMQVVSQMQGVKVDLPQPLGKAASDLRTMDMTLHFNPEFNRMTGTFGDNLISDMSFSKGTITQGVVSYDRTNLVSTPNEVLVAAYLPTTELAIWQPTIELFSRNSAKAVSPKLWKPVFDLKFDELELATFNLKDINAEIRLNPESTDIQFTSQLGDGMASLPTNDRLVPTINLSRLSLPKEMLQEKIGQEAIDPRLFLAANVSVDQLSVGDAEWGSIAFEVRPEVSGAAFNRIKGDLFGLQPGASDKEPATEFFWSFDGTNYGSRLLGPIGIGDIGDMFTAFNIGKVADSTSGKMTVDLFWQDKPWNITKDNISGDFQIFLKDGSFYKSSGGADAALKLVSLFNFANWLRRLQLDFSDVVGQNLAYNDLMGIIHFEDGVAQLQEPLKMKMPSGRMSMAGNFDLINETVDARLVATLPVATNLPWVVALLGGLPAAAGVYLTSKLVEKQVDRLSSISYKVAGPWDDIEVSVDSIFAAELKNETQEAAKSAKPKTSPEPIEQDKKPIPEEASAPEAFTPQPKVESPQ